VPGAEGRSPAGRATIAALRFSSFPEVLLSSGAVEVPTLVYDLQEPGDGAVWCVIAVLERDRAAFAESLRGLAQQSPASLKGAVRTLTLEIGDADKTHTNPTRLSLRAQTAAALSESLARGEVELRVEGVAAIEVLPGGYELAGSFPSS
jgi:hypothetical protein